jgi:peptide/nickel transport system permease protein
VRSYAVRRILLVIPTMLLLTLAVFFMVRLIPGDMVSMMVTQQQFAQGSSSKPALDVNEIRQELGLDKPIYTQYFTYLWGIISRGDFGHSLWDNTKLTDMLRLKLPVTLELSILSLIIGLALSIPLGIYSAIRQDTIGDYIGRTASILALAVPSFWLATLIMIYPSIWWGWAPRIRYIPLTQDFWGNVEQFLIPAFIMGLSTAGGTMRITRTMMLEVLRQDYVRTAWSKGLRERVIVLRHAVRNTLIPVITIVGGIIPGLFGGAVIMEQIFSLPGMGRYLLEAISNRDYLIVSGQNLIFASFTMVIIVLTDLAYAYVDPRIRYT